MPDTVETSVAADSVEDSSIAEHEAAFMEGPAPAAKAEADSPEPAVEPTSRTRDKSGKFLSKGRTSEPATEPVIKTEPAAAVETLDTLRERLRARDAEFEALKATRSAPQPPAPARELEPQAKPAESEPAETFPEFEDWAQIKGNEQKTIKDYILEGSAWNYNQLRQQERNDEAAKAAVTKQNELLSAYSAQLPAVIKKYPDYEAVVVKADPERIKTSKVIERAVLEIGPEMAYYLVTHDQERRELSDESLVDPENPAFPSAVAAMKRYLKTLIAVEPPAAEPKLVATRPTLVPRPPSPTKTGGMPPNDEPPDDDAASIAAHEAYYGPKKGRR